MHTQLVSVNHYLFMPPNEQGNAEGLPDTLPQQMLLTTPQCFYVEM